MKIMNRGFLTVEIILAIATLGTLATAFGGILAYGQDSTQIAGNRMLAINIAEEGLEAVRSIRNENFSNLNAGTYGLALNGGCFIFSGTSDEVGIFTRSILISNYDENRKDVNVSVSWKQNTFRNADITLSSRLTNWQIPQPPPPPPPIP